MIHLNATLTFDKREDESKIEEFQNKLFSYNIKTKYINILKNYSIEKILMKIIYKI